MLLRCPERVHRDTLNCISKGKRGQNRLGTRLDENWTIGKNVELDDANPKGPKHYFSENRKKFSYFLPFEDRCNLKMFLMLIFKIFHFILFSK